MNSVWVSGFSHCISVEPLPWHSLSFLLKTFHSLTGGENTEEMQTVFILCLLYSQSRRKCIFLIFQQLGHIRGGRIGTDFTAVLTTGIRCVPLTLLLVWVHRPSVPVAWTLYFPFCDCSNQCLSTQATLTLYRWHSLFTPSRRESCFLFFTLGYLQLLHGSLTLWWRLSQEYSREWVISL